MPKGARSTRRVDHCSDYLLNVASGDVLDFHNEDSGLSDVNKTYLANATIDKDSFLAYVYMGDLATGAFGLNSKIAFSVNYLGPEKAVVGAARNFASRALLAATTWDQALEAAAPPNFSAGHNYQIMDLQNK